MRSPPQGWWLAAAAVFSSVLVWALVGMAAVYENFDGPYYAVVAKSWYDKELIAKTFSFPLPLEYYPAHLPLFPAMMAVFSLSGAHLLTSGVVINVATSALVAVMFWWIYRRMGIRHACWLALAWLFLWPRMWAVRSVVSPETLFVGLVFGSIYFFERKQFLRAGILGGLATLTKSPGLLLVPTFGICLLAEFLQTKRIEGRVWPLVLIPLSFLLLAGFYYIRTGDFWAYFNSGDNRHLGLIPFTVFASSQSWVGTFWLEDVMWIYVLGVLGSALALRKNKVWGVFGLVFMTAVMFVSHRDISRYSLPVVPVVLLGAAELFENRLFRLIFLFWLIPMLFYTVNFVSFNRVGIADWAPFFLFSK